MKKKKMTSVMLMTTLHHQWARMPTHTNPLVKAITPQPTTLHHLQTKQKITIMQMSTIMKKITLVEKNIHTSTHRTTLPTTHHRHPDLLPNLMVASMTIVMNDTTPTLVTQAPTTLMQATCAILPKTHATTLNLVVGGDPMM